MNTDLPTQPEQSNEVIPTPYVVVGVVVAIVLALGMIIGVLWLANAFPAQIEAVRDVFIIALALQSCLFGIVLILMLIMLIRLVNTLEFEIKPILEQTNETIGTIRGTTGFVSKNVVDPVVRVTGYAAGVRRGLKVLFGDPRRNLPD